MAEANASNLICTIIACFGSLLGMILIIKMFKHKNDSVHPSIYWTTFTTISWYTLTMIVCFISFVIHLVHSTTIQHIDNKLGFILVDQSYQVCYVSAMVSMLLVFLLRVRITFQGSNDKLPGRIGYKLIIALVIYAFLGYFMAILDIVGTLVPTFVLYILASIYMVILFGVCLYSLRIFNLKIKQLYSLCIVDGNNNEDNKKLVTTALTVNDNSEQLELYHISVQITLIAYFAIISTFVLIFLCVIVDTIQNYAVSDENVLRNDLEYVQRTLVVLDAVIGSLATYLQISPNAMLYKMLCQRFEHRYLARQKMRNVVELELEQKTTVRV
eukprot:240302_1